MCVRCGAACVNNEISEGIIITLWNAIVCIFTEKGISRHNEEGLHIIYVSLWRPKYENEWNIVK